MSHATPTSSTTSARPEPESAREVIIERDFDAPVHLVFEAFTKPEHLLRWFGPGEYPLTHCELDFRVGGRFRFAMTGPDGQQGPFFGGEYLEIVPDQRIVYTNGFLFEGAGQMIITLSFNAHEGGTRLVSRTLFESVAMKDEHLGMGFLQGTGLGLDQLAALLPSLQKAP